MTFRKFIFGLLLVSLAPSLFALNPAQEATLWRHLVEVNVQWKKQVADPSPFQELVVFETEAARIQMHLLLVETLLRSRKHSEMDAASLAERMQMLDALHHYALSGAFPQNNDHPQRRPYFIDHQGTACAVGHLLIESGYGAFAEHIRQDGNNAYIHDLDYAELPVWASAHGFTLDELAWIQPGYPFTDTWSSPVGSGVNGPVNFLKVLPTGGNLVVSGSFTSADGNAVDNAFILTTTGAVSPMGTGLDGQIHCMVEYDNNLLFGGDFNNNGGCNLAIYDPVFETWTYEQVFAGVIYDMEVLNGKLYAGGDLTFSGALLVQHIVEFNNGTWTSVGQGFDAPVRSLAVLNNTLYAGGHFQNSIPNSTPYVAKWDGSNWLPVGNRNLGSPVLVLEENNGELWAGGALLDSATLSTPLFGMARFSNGDWVVLTDSFPAPLYIDQGNPQWPYIHEFDFDGNRVFASGRFTVIPFAVGTYGSDLVEVLSNGELKPLVTPDSGSAIQSAAVWQGKLIIGGDLSGINGQAAQNIAQKDVPAAVAAELESLSMEIYPNPVHDWTIVSLPESKDWKGVELKVYGLDGREMDARFDLDGRSARLSLQMVPAGVYIIRLEKDGLGIASQMVIRN